LWDGTQLTVMPLVAALKGHTEMVLRVVFHPAGHILVSVSCDGSIRLWDIERALRGSYSDGPACVGVMLGHEGVAFAASFHPKGELFASCGDDGWIKVWNVKAACQPCSARDAGLIQAKSNQAERAAFEAHASTVADVAYSHSGDMMVSCSWDPSVKLWDSETQVCLGVIKCQSDAFINCVSWSPNDEYIAVASDSNITLWSSNGAELLATMAAHAGPVNTCKFQSSNGSILVSGSADATVKLWDCSENSIKRSADHSGLLDGHPSKVTMATYDITGTKLASACGPAVFTLVAGS